MIVVQSPSIPTPLLAIDNKSYYGSSYSGYRNEGDHVYPQYRDDGLQIDIETYNPVTLLPEPDQRLLVQSLTQEDNVETVEKLRMENQELKRQMLMQKTEYQHNLNVVYKRYDDLRLRLTDVLTRIDDSKSEIKRLLDQQCFIE
jgi:hypothetical protein